MDLREQKKTGGKEIPWTLEELEAGFMKFFQDNRRYPTSTEIDSYQYLPSARTIERSFGGLVTLRKQLNLGKDHDFREGAHSSRRAHTINERAHKVEQGIYEYLSDKFKREFVHREYFFTDDTRTRTDFLVYDKDGGFCVDAFYPSSTRNLTICLNLKLEKYQGLGMFIKEHPIIFLQMNKDIQQDEIDQLVKRKKKPIPKNQYVMSWETFEKFSSSRKPLKVDST